MPNFSAEELISSGLPCNWCHSSDAMAEYTHSYFCYSCRRYESKTRHSPKRKLERLKIVSYDSPTLPDGLSEEYPKEAQLWFLQHGLTKPLREKWRIRWAEHIPMWSPRLNKIVDVGPR